MGQLRAEEDAAISIVADRAGTVVGDAMPSRMTAPIRALASASVAVAPDVRRCGIGSGLVGFALDAAAREGWRAAFVLEDAGSGDGAA